MSTLLYDKFARMSVHWKHGIKYVTATKSTLSVSGSRMGVNKMESQKICDESQILLTSKLIGNVTSE